MEQGTDWAAWHDEYADAGSPLSRRLRIIQHHLDAYLDETAPRSIRALSACAGDGRDLLGVLSRRTDAARVSATLMELDPGLAKRAAEAASVIGLGGVEVRCADAGTSAAYADAVPADLVLLCGVFGNVADDDVRRTIGALPAFCRPGALVIWTRHRRSPDLTPAIRAWFGQATFEEQAFTAPADVGFSVGAHRFRGDTTSLEPGVRLFSFLR